MYLAQIDTKYILTFIYIYNQRSLFTQLFLMDKRLFSLLYIFQYFIFFTCNKTEQNIYLPIFLKQKYIQFLKQFFFEWWLEFEPEPYIYYVLFIPTELSLRERFLKQINHTFYFLKNSSYFYSSFLGKDEGSKQFQR